MLFDHAEGKLNGNLIEKFRILDYCGFDRIKWWLAKICPYYTLITIIVVACTSTHSLFWPKRLSIKFVTKTKLFIEYSQFHFRFKKKLFQPSLKLDFFCLWIVHANFTQPHNITLEKIYMKYPYQEWSNLESKTQPNYCSFYLTCILDELIDHELQILNEAAGIMERCIVRECMKKFD